MGWLPSVVTATDTQSSKGMLEIIIITYDVLRVEYLISGVYQSNITLYCNDICKLQVAVNKT